MDEKDEYIIEILKKNAKLPTQKISSRLGIPVTTVHNRIKRLEKNGIIKNYTIDLDYDKLGKPISALVLISLDLKQMKEVHQSAKELAKKLKMIQDVTRVYIVTGSRDLILRIRVKDILSLDRILTEDLMKIGCISRTETMIVTHEV